MSFTPIDSYSSLRNTQNEFETTMILRPDTNKEGIQELVVRLQSLFEANGGRMQKIDNWGRRTLAYPIETNRQGIYLYIRHLGGSQMVNELERNLQIFPTVMRYLTVVIDDNVDPEARPSDVDDETLDAATESAPDPVDIAAEAAAAEKAAADKIAAEAAAEKAAADKIVAEAAAAEKAIADKAAAAEKAIADKAAAAEKAIADKAAAAEKAIADKAAAEEAAKDAPAVEADAQTPATKDGE